MSLFVGKKAPPPKSNIFGALPILLIEGDIDAIEDFLQYCSNMLLTTFTQIAIDLPIQDMNIARLITRYSNSDVLMAIQERKADREVASVETPTQTVDSTGRAKRIAKE